MRKVIPLATAGVIAVAAAVTIAVTAAPDTRAAPPGPAAPSTVKVAKVDLSDTLEVTGVLGFGTTQTLVGRRPGTITWLPAAGSVIDRGEALYKVDNRPVPLFVGGIPLWRKLNAPGTKGPDVAVIKKNLAALGFLSRSAGEELTPATVDAIKRWQKSLNLDKTGAIDVGDVAVLPGKIRVATAEVRLAGGAAGDVLSYTSTGKSVTASVDTGQAGAFKTGAKVTVVLPNGKEIPGTVSGISKAAAEGNNSGDGQGGRGDQSKLAVGIAVNDKAIGDPATGPVRVRIASDTRKGVLAVPVTALLALREGGYAVQVKAGGKTTMIGVKTGLFADGMVEISGVGIRDGLDVVTVS